MNLISCKMARLSLLVSFRGLGGLGAFQEASSDDWVSAGLQACMGMRAWLRVGPVLISADCALLDYIQLVTWICILFLDWSFAAWLCLLERFFSCRLYMTWLVYLRLIMPGRLQHCLLFVANPLARRQPGFLDYFFYTVIQATVEPPAFGTTWTCIRSPLCWNFATTLCPAMRRLASRGCCLYTIGHLHFPRVSASGLPSCTSVSTNRRNHTPLTSGTPNSYYQELPRQICKRIPSPPRLHLQLYNSTIFPAVPTVLGV